MFRQNRHKIKVIEYKGGTVKPKHGCYTLYWWKKGNIYDGHYYKADLYGLDGEILMYGIVDNTLEMLVEQVKQTIAPKQGKFY